MINDATSAAQPHLLPNLSRSEPSLATHEKATLRSWLSVAGVVVVKPHFSLLAIATVRRTSELLANIIPAT